MIFPFPFSGTRSRIYLCPSRNPGRKICSRKFVLGNLLSEICSRQLVFGISGKPKAVYFWSVFLSIHLSFLVLKAFTATTELNQPKVENKNNSFSLSSLCFCFCLCFYYLQIIVPLCHRFNTLFYFSMYGFCSFCLSLFISVSVPFFISLFLHVCKHRSGLLVFFYPFPTLSFPLYFFLRSPSLFLSVFPSFILNFSFLFSGTEMRCVYFALEIRDENGNF